MGRKLAVMGALCLLLFGVSHSTVNAKGPHGPPIYYLSLGTSLAAGVQADPSTGEDIATETSYPSLLADSLRETRIPTLAHVNLGYSGETSEEFIHGGECVYPHGSQLDQAAAFLHAHRKFTALITIDIGANDVMQCVDGVTVDPWCLNEKLEQLTDNLDYILETLGEEAPDVPIVAMNYYNPYLAYYFVDPIAAEQTIMLQMLVNQTLETVLPTTVFPWPMLPKSSCPMTWKLMKMATKYRTALNGCVPGHGCAVIRITIPMTPATPRSLSSFTKGCRIFLSGPPRGVRSLNAASGYAAIAELFYERLPDLPVCPPSPGARGVIPMNDCP